MPFNPRRSLAAAFMGSLTLVAGLVLAEGPALAQQADPAQAQPQQQPTGPVKINLQASQAQWTKVCGSAGPNHPVCFTTRDFTQAPDQPPLIALAIYDIKGSEPIMRFLMPPGLLLKPGIRFQADKGQQQDASYTICLPNGCFAENKVKPAVIEGMKKATSLSIQARNSVNAEVTFVIPMAGFGKAFDGPAMDPKVLQQQQQEVLQQQQAQQQELQRQLEERAKQQRETLEKGGATPPAAPPAPAAPAAPKK